ncbi:hypothetical protein Q1695_015820 [Nippostrongylus brasiliensis]|nr:hypothetical protein Q1695_015820 [Nippostrongylus brasiliensis]
MCRIRRFQHLSILHSKAENFHQKKRHFDIVEIRDRRRPSRPHLPDIPVPTLGNPSLDDRELPPEGDNPVIRETHHSQSKHIVITEQQPPQFPEEGDNFDLDVIGSRRRPSQPHVPDTAVPTFIIPSLEGRELPPEEENFDIVEIRGRRRPSRPHLPDIPVPTLGNPSLDDRELPPEGDNPVIRETHHSQSKHIVITEQQPPQFPEEGDNFDLDVIGSRRRPKSFLDDRELPPEGDKPVIRETHHSQSKHIVITEQQPPQFPEEGDNFDLDVIGSRRRPGRPHLPDTAVPSLIKPSLDGREFPPEGDKPVIRETHHSQSKHIVITEQQPPQFPEEGDNFDLDVIGSRRRPSQPHVPDTAVPTFINPSLEGRELPPEEENFDIVEIRGRRRPSRPHLPDIPVPTVVNPSLDDRELPPEGDNPVIRETHHSQSKHIVITEQQPPQFPEEGDNFDLDVIGSRRRPSRPHLPDTAVPSLINPSLDGRELPPEGDNFDIVEVRGRRRPSRPHLPDIPVPTVVNSSLDDRELPPEGDNPVIRETHHSQSKHIVITEQQPPQFPEEGDNFDLDVIGSRRRPSRPHLPDTAVPSLIKPSLDGREFPPEGDKPVIRETHHSQSKHIVITEQQPPQFPEEGDNFDLDVIGSRRRPSQPHVPDTAVPTFINPSLEGRELPPEEENFDIVEIRGRRRPSRPHLPDIPVPTLVNPSLDDRELPPEGDNPVIRETHHSQSKHIVITEQQPPQFPEEGDNFDLDVIGSRRRPSRPHLPDTAVPSLINPSLDGREFPPEGDNPVIRETHHSQSKHIVITEQQPPQFPEEGDNFDLDVIGSRRRPSQPHVPDTAVPTFINPSLEGRELPPEGDNFDIVEIRGRRRPGRPHLPDTAVPSLIKPSLDGRELPPEGDNPVIRETHHSQSKHIVITEQQPPQFPEEGDNFDLDVIGSRRRPGRPHLPDTAVPSLIKPSLDGRELPPEEENFDIVEIRGRRRPSRPHLPDIPVPTLVNPSLDDRELPPEGDNPVIRETHHSQSKHIVITEQQPPQFPEEGDNFDLDVIGSRRRPGRPHLPDTAVPSLIKPSLDGREFPPEGDKPVIRETHHSQSKHIVITEQQPPQFPEEGDNFDLDVIGSRRRPSQPHVPDTAVPTFINPSLDGRELPPEEENFDIVEIRGRRRPSRPHLPDIPVPTLVNPSLDDRELPPEGDNPVIRETHHSQSKHIVITEQQPPQFPEEGDNFDLDVIGSRRRPGRPHLPDTAVPSLIKPSLDGREFPPEGDNPVIRETHHSQSKHIVITEQQPPQFPEEGDNFDLDWRSEVEGDPVGLICRILHSTTELSNISESFGLICLGLDDRELPPEGDNPVIRETHHSQSKHIVITEQQPPQFPEEGDNFDLDVIGSRRRPGRPHLPDTAVPSLIKPSLDGREFPPEGDKPVIRETHHSQSKHIVITEQQPPQFPEEGDNFDLDVIGSRRRPSRPHVPDTAVPTFINPSLDGRELPPEEENFDIVEIRGRRRPSRPHLPDIPVPTLVNPSLDDRELPPEGDNPVIRETHHSQSKHIVITEQQPPQFPEEGDNFDLDVIGSRRRPSRPHLPDTAVPSLIKPSLDGREHSPEGDNPVIRETHHSQSKHIVITEQQPPQFPEEGDNFDLDVIGSRRRPGRPHLPDTAVPSLIKPSLDGRELPPEEENFDIVEIRGRRRPSRPHLPDIPVPTLVNPSLDDRELSPEGDNPVIRETHHSQSKHIVITEQQPPQFPEEGDNFDLDVIGSRRRPSRPHLPDTAVPSLIKPSLDGREHSPEGDNPVIRETHHSQSKHIVITEQQPPQFPEEGDNFDLDVIGSRRRPGRPHLPDTAVPSLIKPSLDGRELPPEEENFDIVEIRDVIGSRRRPGRPHLPDIPVPTLVNPSLDDRELPPEGDNPVIRETHHSQSKHIVITEQQPPQFPEEGDNFDLDVIGSRRRPSQPHVPDTAVPTFIIPSLEGRELPPEEENFDIVEIRGRRRPSRPHLPDIPVPTLVNPSLDDRELPPEGDNPVIRETHHSQSKHIVITEQQPPQFPEEGDNFDLDVIGSRRRPSRPHLPDTAVPSLINPSLDGREHSPEGDNPVIRETHHSQSKHIVITEQQPPQFPEEGDNFDLDVIGSRRRPGRPHLPDTAVPSLIKPSLDGRELPPEEENFDIVEIRGRRRPSRPHLPDIPVPTLVNPSLDGREHSPEGDNPVIRETHHSQSKHIVITEQQPPQFPEEGDNFDLDVIGSRRRPGRPHLPDTAVPSLIKPSLDGREHSPEGDNPVIRETHHSQSKHIVITEQQPPQFPEEGDNFDLDVIGSRRRPSQPHVPDTAVPTFINPSLEGRELPPEGDNFDLDVIGSRRRPGRPHLPDIPVPTLVNPSLDDRELPPEGDNPVIRETHHSQSKHIVITEQQPPQFPEEGDNFDLDVIGSRRRPSQPHVPDTAVPTFIIPSLEGRELPPEEENFDIVEIRGRRRPSRPHLPDTAVPSLINPSLDGREHSPEGDNPVIRETHHSQSKHIVITEQQPPQFPEEGDNFDLDVIGSRRRPGRPHLPDTAAPSLIKPSLDGRELPPEEENFDIVEVRGRRRPSRPHLPDIPVPTVVNPSLDDRELPPEGDNPVIRETHHSQSKHIVITEQQPPQFPEEGDNFDLDVIGSRRRPSQPHVPDTAVPTFINPSLEGRELPPEEENFDIVEIRGRRRPSRPHLPDIPVPTLVNPSFDDRELSPEGDNPVIRETHHSQSKHIVITEQQPPQFPEEGDNFDLDVIGSRRRPGRPHLPDTAVPSLIKPSLDGREFPPEGDKPVIRETHHSQSKHIVITEQQPPQFPEEGDNFDLDVIGSRRRPSQPHVPDTAVPTFINPSLEGRELPPEGDNFDIVEIRGRRRPGRPHLPDTAVPSLIKPSLDGREHSPEGDNPVIRETHHSQSKHIVITNQQPPQFPEEGDNFDLDVIGSRRRPSQPHVPDTAVPTFINPSLEGRELPPEEENFDIVEIRGRRRPSRPHLPDIPVPTLGNPSLDDRELPPEGDKPVIRETHHSQSKHIVITEQQPPQFPEEGDNFDLDVIGSRRRPSQPHVPDTAVPTFIIPSLEGRELPPEEENFDIVEVRGRRRPRRPHLPDIPVPTVVNPSLDDRELPPEGDNPVIRETHHSQSKHIVITEQQPPQFPEEGDNFDLDVIGSRRRPSQPHVPDTAVPTFINPSLEGRELPPEEENFDIVEIRGRRRPSRPHLPDIPVPTLVNPSFDDRELSPEGDNPVIRETHHSQSKHIVITEQQPPQFPEEGDNFDLDVIGSRRRPGRPHLPDTAVPSLIKPSLDGREFPPEGDKPVIRETHHSQSKHIVITEQQPPQFPEEGDNFDLDVIGSRRRPSQPHVPDTAVPTFINPSLEGRELPPEGDNFDIVEIRGRRRPGRPHLPDTAVPSLINPSLDGREHSPEGDNPVIRETHHSQSKHIVITEQQPPQFPEEGDNFDLDVIGRRRRPGRPHLPDTAVPTFINPSLEGRELPPEGDNFDIVEIRGRRRPSRPHLPDIPVPTLVNPSLDDRELPPEGDNPVIRETHHSQSKHIVITEQQPPQFPEEGDNFDLDGIGSRRRPGRPHLPDTAVPSLIKPSLDGREFPPEGDKPVIRETHHSQSKHIVITEQQPPQFPEEGDNFDLDVIGSRRRPSQPHVPDTAVPTFIIPSLEGRELPPEEENFDIVEVRGRRRPSRPHLPDIPVPTVVNPSLDDRELPPEGDNPVIRETHHSQSKHIVITEQQPPHFPEEGDNFDLDVIGSRRRPSQPHVPDTAVPSLIKPSLDGREFPPEGDKPVIRETHHSQSKHIVITEQQPPQFPEEGDNFDLDVIGSRRRPGRPHLPDTAVPSLIKPSLDGRELPPEEENFDIVEIRGRRRPSRPHLPDIPVPTLVNPSLDDRELPPEGDKPVIRETHHSQSKHIVITEQQPPQFPEEGDNFDLDVIGSRRRPSQPHVPDTAVPTFINPSLEGRELPPEEENFDIVEIRGRRRPSRPHLPDIPVPTLGNPSLDDRKLPPEGDNPVIRETHHSQSKHIVITEQQPPHFPEEGDNFDLDVIGSRRRPSRPHLPDTAVPSLINPSLDGREFPPEGDNPVIRETHHSQSKHIVITEQQPPQFPEEGDNFDLDVIGSRRRPGRPHLPDTAVPSLINPSLDGRELPPEEENFDIVEIRGRRRPSRPHLPDIPVPTLVNPSLDDRELPPEGDKSNVIGSRRRPSQPHVPDTAVPTFINPSLEGRELPPEEENFDIVEIRGRRRPSRPHLPDIPVPTLGNPSLDDRKLPPEGDNPVIRETHHSQSKHIVITEQQPPQFPEEGDNFDLDVIGSRRRPSQPHVPDTAVPTFINPSLEGRELPPEEENFDIVEIRGRRRPSRPHLPDIPVPTLGNPSLDDRKLPPEGDNPVIRETHHSQSKHIVITEQQPPQFPEEGDNFDLDVIGSRRRPSQPHVPDTAVPTFINPSLEGRELPPEEENFDIVEIRGRRRPSRPHLPDIPVPTLVNPSFDDRELSPEGDNPVIRETHHSQSKHIVITEQQPPQFPEEGDNFDLDVIGSRRRPGRPHVPDTAVPTFINPSLEGRELPPEEENFDIVEIRGRRRPSRPHLPDIPVPTLGNPSLDDRELPPEGDNSMIREAHHTESKHIAITELQPPQFPEEGDNFDLDVIGSRRRPSRSHLPDIPIPTYINPSLDDRKFLPKQDNSMIRGTHHSQSKHIVISKKQPPQFPEVGDNFDLDEIGSRRRPGQPYLPDTAVPSLIKPSLDGREFPPEGDNSMIREAHHTESKHIAITELQPPQFPEEGDNFDLDVIGSRRRPSRSHLPDIPIPTYINPSLDDRKFLPKQDNPVIRETHHSQSKHIVITEQQPPQFPEEGDNFDLDVIGSRRRPGRPHLPDTAVPSLIKPSLDGREFPPEGDKPVIRETHHSQSKHIVITEQQPPQFPEEGDNFDLDVIGSRRRPSQPHVPDTAVPTFINPSLEGRELPPEEENFDIVEIRGRRRPSRPHLPDIPVPTLGNPSLDDRELPPEGDNPVIRETHHSQSKHIVITEQQPPQFPEEGDNFDLDVIGSRRRPSQPHVPDTAVPTFINPSLEGRELPPEEENFDIVEIRGRRRPSRPHLPDIPVPTLGNPSLDDRELPPEGDNSMIREAHHTESKHIAITELQPPQFPEEGDNFDLDVIGSRRRPSRSHLPDIPIPTYINPSLDDRKFLPKQDNSMIRGTHHSQSKHIVISKKQPPQFPEVGDNFDLDEIGSRRRPGQPYLPDTAVPSLIKPSLDGREFPPEGDNSMIREAHHTESKHIAITELQPPQFPEEGDNFDLDVIGSRRRPSRSHLPDIPIPTYINPSLDDRKFLPEEENFDIVEIRGRRRPSRPHLPDIPVPTLGNPSLDDRELPPEGDNSMIREAHQTESKHIAITEQQPLQFPEEGDNFDLDVIGSRRRPSQPHAPDTAVPTFINPSLEGRELPPEGDIFDIVEIRGRRRPSRPHLPDTALPTLINPSLDDREFLPKQDNSVIREAHHTERKHIVITEQQPLQFPEEGDNFDLDVIGSRRRPGRPHLPDTAVPSLIKPSLDGREFPPEGDKPVIRETHHSQSKHIVITEQQPLQFPEEGDNFDLDVIGSRRRPSQPHAPDTAVPTFINPSLEGRELPPEGDIFDIVEIRGRRRPSRPHLPDTALPTLINPSLDDREFLPKQDNSVIREAHHTERKHIVITEQQPLQFPEEGDNFDLDVIGSRRRPGRPHLPDTAVPSLIKPSLDGREFPPEGDKPVIRETHHSQSKHIVITEQQPLQFPEEEDNFDLDVIGSRRRPSQPHVPDTAVPTFINPSLEGRELPPEEENFDIVEIRGRRRPSRPHLPDIPVPTLVNPSLDDRELPPEGDNSMIREAHHTESKHIAITELQPPQFPEEGDNFDLDVIGSRRRPSRSHLPDIPIPTYINPSLDDRKFLPKQDNSMIRGTHHSQSKHIVISKKQPPQFPEEGDNFDLDEIGSRRRPGQPYLPDTAVPTFTNPSFEGTELPPEGDNFDIVEIRGRRRKRCRPYLPDTPAPILINPSLDGRDFLPGGDNSVIKESHHSRSKRIVVAEKQSPLFPEEGDNLDIVEIRGRRRRPCRPPLYDLLIPTLSNPSLREFPPEGDNFRGVMNGRSWKIDTRPHLYESPIPTIDSSLDNGEFEQMRSNSLAEGVACCPPINVRSPSKIENRSVKIKVVLKRNSELHHSGLDHVIRPSLHDEQRPPAETVLRFRVRITKQSP